MRMKLFWGKSLRFQRHRRLWGFSVKHLFFGVMREYPFEPWVYERHTDHESDDPGAGSVEKKFKEPQL